MQVAPADLVQLSSREPMATVLLFQARRETATAELAREVAAAYPGAGPR